MESKFNYTCMYNTYSTFWRSKEIAMIWKSRIYLIPYKVVWDTYDINDDKNYYIQNILNG